MHFSGETGVMVQTNRPFRTLVLYDKSTFDLTPQSRDILLSAIMCEKGKVLDIFLT